jgi:hypothetical protein
VGLAERLGVPESAIARVPLLNTPKLADPETLLDAAFATGPSDKEAAGLLLASAILSQAQRTKGGSPRPCRSSRRSSPRRTPTSPSARTAPRGAPSRSPTAGATRSGPGPASATPGGKGCAASSR